MGQIRTRMGHAADKGRRPFGRCSYEACSRKLAAQALPCRDGGIAAMGQQAAQDQKCRQERRGTDAHQQQQ